MKVVVVVVCFEDHGDHSLLSHNIKNTWGKTETPDFQIWYLWANTREKREHHDYIISVEEGYGAMIKKVIKFINFYKTNEFDYLVKVNTGSYIDRGRLFKFLDGKPREKFFCGTPDRWEHIHFVSGSCIILSRDLAMSMLERRRDFGPEHIDDVAIGLFMMQHNIPIDQRAIRLTYHGEGMMLQIGNPIIPEPEFDYNNVYHYRLRNRDGERHIDCDHMQRLFKELNP